MLGILEAQLGRHTYLQGIAVLRGQRFLAEAQCQDGLRMQRRGHVQAGVIAVRTFEAHVFRREIRADRLQEQAQRHARPLADGAPSFDADVTRDLRRLRQRAQALQIPAALVADQAGDFQFPVAAIDVGRIELVIKGVEGKRIGDLAGRIGRCQFLAAEQQCLHPVIPARHGPQDLVHAVVVLQVAARQHRQRPHRERRAQHEAALHIQQGRAMVGQQDLAGPLRTWRFDVFLVFHDALAS